MYTIIEDNISVGFFREELDRNLAFEKYFIKKLVRISNDQSSKIVRLNDDRIRELSKDHKIEIIKERFGYKGDTNGSK